MQLVLGVSQFTALAWGFACGFGVRGVGFRVLKAVWTFGDEGLAASLA